MKSYDFIIGPSDTDSISFTKADMAPFSEMEIKSLIKELNDISPEFMIWDDDGYYQSCIALKAKNYVLFDGKKKTVKGSAFKTSSKEIALKEMMQALVDEMLNDNNMDVLVKIYHSYVYEVINLKDIRRWSQKKSVTKSILNCLDYTPKMIEDKDLRKNETDVWDAIKGEELIQEGDKVYMYPIVLGERIIPGGYSEKTGKPLKDKKEQVTGLRLDKYWDNNHNVEKLLERIYATVYIFANVLDMSLFIDYSKPRNRTQIKELINE